MTFFYLQSKAYDIALIYCFIKILSHFFALYAYVYEKKYHSWNYYQYYCWLRFGLTFAPIYPTIHSVFRIFIVAISLISNINISSFVKGICSIETYDIISSIITIYCLVSVVTASLHDRRVFKYLRPKDIDMLPIEIIEEIINSQITYSANLLTTIADEKLFDELLNRINVIEKEFVAKLRLALNEIYSSLNNNTSCSSIPNLLNDYLLYHSLKGYSEKSNAIKNAYKNLITIQRVRKNQIKKHHTMYSDDIRSYLTSLCKESINLLEKV